MHRWAKRFWHGHALAGCESAALAPCDSRPVAWQGVEWRIFPCASLYKTRESRSVAALPAFATSSARTP